METTPLDTITLSPGAHKTREDGVCLMEAVAWWQGEGHSDRPECTCPVLATFARRVNDIDWPGDLRNRLLVVLPDLVGTAAPTDVWIERAQFFAKWAARLAKAPGCEFAREYALSALLYAARAANHSGYYTEAAAARAANAADVIASNTRVAPGWVMTKCIAAIRGAAAIGRTAPKLPMPTELVAVE